MKRLAYLLGAVLLCVCLLNTVLAQAAGKESNAPAWAEPNVMAVKRVGPVTTIQHEPNLLSNLDCSLMDYRLVDDSITQTGCFTPTAFGQIDSDNDISIFNGTDGGLQLLPYSAHQVLVPWPGALDLVVLDAANTGGSYISLYKDPLASLRDQRDSAGKLVAKQLASPPDLILRGPDGKQLVINPQTMAFSDGGSWLAAETLDGSFVRINLATLDMTAFATAFGSQGSPALLKSQVAVSDDGRYVAIGNDVAASLKVYDLSTCNGSAVGLQPQNCASYDYWPFARQQIAGLQSVRHLRFVNENLLTLEARTNNPASGGVYELAPQASITSLIDYLGLGDSYTSGEGAFDYVSGTDTGDNACHLSADSYPLRLTLDLFSAAGGHSIACSGAVINDIASTSLNYRGQVRGVGSLAQLQSGQAALLDSIMANYSPGYVAQQRFVKQYQPATVTIGVGGNDIGFGDILQKCVEPHVSLHSSGNTCYNSYEDRLEVIRLIDRTVPRWGALYRQLAAEAPGTQLYAIGYPQIVVDNSSCALNVHLNRAELEFSEELIDYLNESIQQAAAASGVTFVDISQALAGHRLCEAASYDVAVNGLTAGGDAGVLGLKIFGKESYHPNALGQALIEQAILKQTHNLAAASAAGSVGTDDQAFLNVPKTGRTVNVVVPDDNLTGSVVLIGRNTLVQASGTTDGLKPNAVYIIKLDGPSGPAVGTTVSNVDGDISTNVTLPDNTVPGEHTIDITGNNQDDDSTDITQPIYVPVSDNDADGDSTPDSLDTCPGATDSGQDSDRDGVDDSCDPLIGPPSTVGGQGGSGSNHTDNADKPGAGVALNSSVSAVTTSSNHTAPILLTGQAKDKPSPAVQTAAKPQITVNKPPELTASPGSEELARPLTKLYVINWLVLLALLVIAWLLVMLGLLAKRLAGRLAQTAYT